ncbi:MAG: xylulokinase [Microbacter sp.]
MYLLGYDIGSSSVKASLVEAATGKSIAHAFSPQEEMRIDALHTGWAEQHPEWWWENLKRATQQMLHQANIDSKEIKAIGISYQMHGLVVVDKNHNVLRPSIIWCDSRAVEYGEKAFQNLGESYCLNHLLNSPGNFTASKLAWIKEHEPKVYEKIDKIMLPGDYIAMKLTDQINTTVSGLSEGIFWDFVNHTISERLLDFFGFSPSLIPSVVPTFGIQGTLSSLAAKELGLAIGTSVTYRAGDQPNNALSLNVFNPGEIAATAGTSGVVYGINDQIKYDHLSRVNNFAHVNHTKEQTRLGVLLCMNGTGILNAWIKKNLNPGSLSYDEMNQLGQKAPIGSDQLVMLPFGNGAERMLNNKEIGSSLHHLNFNRHSQAHLIRAAQEGIAYSLAFGMDIMAEMGIQGKVIRAGKGNLFLSPLFRQTLANVTNATIELYETDGADGAAKGAGIGAGIYRDEKEAFESLLKAEIIEPKDIEQKATSESYQHWRTTLMQQIKEIVDNQPLETRS